MNKLVGTKPNGDAFLVLILEPGNLHKLKNHQALFLRVEDMFPDGIPKRLEIDVFYSETPVKDLTELKALAEVAMDEAIPSDLFIRQFPEVKQATTGGQAGMAALKTEKEN